MKTARRERVILVSLDPGTRDGHVPADLDELTELVRSAGGDVVGTLVQRRPPPGGSAYLGKGKLIELAAQATALKADVVVTRQSLTPVQQRTLEEGVPCRVVDRTTLILDIFAQRARSREGQLQVELAQLLYRLPRLKGGSEALSRLGGGLGTRGPGEQKLEYDRRRIRTRMNLLRDDIEKLRDRRGRQRDRRHEQSWPAVALAGYTNAGKSTLFNALSRAGAMAKQQMFSTLDPQVRQIRLPGGGRALLSDTVGFIQDLPKDLRVAFRATLEEIAAADVVLHVVDASHPDRDRQIEAVRRELADLGAEDMPVITVFNKADRLAIPERAGAELSAATLAPAVLISAVRGDGVPALLSAVERVLQIRFWRHRTWKTPTPALRARLARLGVSVREPAGAGGPLEAWLTPAQAGQLEGGAETDS